MANEITSKNTYTRTDIKTGEITPKAEELILTGLAEKSWVMQNATVEPMNDLIKTFQYTAKNPGAFWVSETKQINASKGTLIRAELRAHKLGVIIPASNEELDFENPNLFEDLAPKITEAFYKKLDEAAILNIDNPFKFSIDGSARTSGNVLEGAITEENMIDLAGLVQAEHDATDYITANSSISTIKKASDGFGNKMYDRADGTVEELPVTFLKLQEFKKNTVYAVDKSKVYIGIPRGFEYKILDQGSIPSLVNEDGSEVNLGVQDMQALRVTFHVAFMVVSDSAFAVLEAETAEPEVGE